MNEIEALQASLAVRGNHTRLKRLMKRAEQGEKLHIGFLGGSITQGSLASTKETCYAALVYQWWKKKFPQSEFSYINAGIGGTTSLYGAARTWEDLMRYRPDFVVVDFTVNDEATEFFQETYEGVIRQVYGDETKPAVVIMNNVYYDTGTNAQEFHNQIGAYYQIPCISMKDSIYQMIQTGSYKEEEITSDHLHPNDKGHGLVAEMITHFLDVVYRDINIEEIEPNYPVPMTENRYEHAKHWQITNCRPKLEGFMTDPRERTAMLDLYKNGWIAERKGEKIIFELECSGISIQYLKSIHQPRPVANAILDGDVAHPIRLDANFDETWGDCLYLQTILHGGEKKRHKLEIEIVQDSPEQAGEFYLVSIITD